MLPEDAAGTPSKSARDTATWANVICDLEKVLLFPSVCLTFEKLIWKAENVFMETMIIIRA